MAWRGPATDLGRNCRGSAAVEFALVAPVLVLLFTGMIAYGIYFGAMHSLQQLAADAARASLAGLNDAERTDLVARFLDENASGYAFIDPRKLDVETVSNPTGTQFVVRLRYDAKDLPIWTLFKDLPLPGKQMSRTSTIRVGGI
nr:MULTISPECIES: TadE/TadG family type IV pilus assembly protein [Chelativorans]